tara:strand:+ start:43 stop:942 length:900 start_codon:yes stop_codon:yes gene_type:complete
MPTSLVHITFIEELGRDQKIEPSLSSSIVQRPELAGLGAVLPDLQYYEYFYRLSLRYLLGFSLPFAPWGYLFHSRAPAALGRALIEVLRKEPVKEQPDAKLALIAGYFSHLALDRTLHPLVQSLVDAEGRNDDHAKAIHGTCERYQSLFFHREIYGVDITGSPICCQKVRLLPPGRRKLDGPIYFFLQKACLETFARFPRKKQFDNWIRGLYLYGWFLSSPLGRYEGLRGDISALRSKYFENEKFSFSEHYRRGKELAVRYLNSAYSYWQQEEFPEEIRKRFLDQITEVDLGYPLTRGI